MNTELSKTAIVILALFKTMSTPTSAGNIVSVYKLKRHFGEARMGLVTNALQELVSEDLIEPIEGVHGAWKLTPYGEL